VLIAAAALTKKSPHCSLVPHFAILAPPLSANGFERFRAA
jgi:hypothetical protein